ncbi:hypothetical protein HYW21_03000 [Candidatus Woesearchaeota archaeon]|nr:hypothetical protein [Candidatus Woesearchaeota archaeon]
MTRFVYTADLHGNSNQYQTLVQYAQEIRASCIILGGDLGSKAGSGDFIAQQHHFFQEVFSQLFIPYFEVVPQGKVFYLLGNDDCQCHLDVCEQYPKERFVLLHNHRSVFSGLNLIGYSCVPLTPFGIKDWEKFDLTDVPEQFIHAHTVRTAHARLSGYKSTPQGWQSFQFLPSMAATDSIQRDLQSSLFLEHPSTTIYIIHTPPFGTALDQISRDVHVGSIALRLFIENTCPLLTLHGHIHETVDISSQFQERIGKTLCCSVGNYPESKKLAVLVADFSDVTKIKRILL